MYSGLIPTKIRELAAGGFRDCIPVRLDGAPNSILTGVGQWRGVKDFEHATLCRAFGLDPCRFFFELPSSVRGVGSNSSGNRGNLLQNGYVMLAGREEPVGKLTIVRDWDKFKDVDPSNMRDFLDLSHS